MIRPLLLFCFLGWNAAVLAQDVMLQGWYWDYPKPATPLLPGSPTWAKTLAQQAADLGTAGFTYVWLPPASRASFGSNSNGYDPQDLYDLGEYGGGATGFGFRADVDAAIAALNTAGIEAVADVVYNHRDGGAQELNNAVRDYVTVHFDPATDEPFPSDRYFVRLPVGGTSGNGAGDYYFKLSSKSGDVKFDGYTYKAYATTDTRRSDPYQGSVNEVEPNGGGICTEPFDNLPLNTDVLATVETTGSCNTDEFKVTLTAADFDPAGDYLYVYTNNTGGYSDHRFYEVYNASATADVAGQLEYLTYTDFTGMPSGQGGMNFESFKPNTGNATTQTLRGDEDQLFFFYDYDQSRTNVRTTLFDWSSWLWDDVGIRGFRMDAVKHFEPGFVGDLLDHLHGQGKLPGMVVGEFFDGNEVLLKNWVDGVRASMEPATVSDIPVRVFDFGLRNALKASSDNFGYDVRNVFNAGVVDGAGGSGFEAVTFLNNHDFRHAGEPVQNNPMLGYAYILTNNQVGLPCVFYPDYANVTPTDAFPNTNLKAPIDALMAVQQQYIAGSMEVDYLSRFSTPYPANYTSGFPNTTLFYQLSGNGAPTGQNVLVAINYAGEALQLTHGIRQDFANAPVGVDNTFTEVLSNSTTSTLTVNGDGEVYIELPPFSYSVWAQSAVLPATLTGFEARLDGRRVVLDWRVAAEEKLSHYAVERSVDGKAWKTIGQVPARMRPEYAYTDALPATGRNYYRLRMVDFDGTETYSEIREVLLGQVPFASITSTVVMGQLDFNYWMPEGRELSVQLIDLTGRVLRTEWYRDTEGTQSVSWSTAHLPAAGYVLCFRSDGWQQTMGFTVE